METTIAVGADKIWAQDSGDPGSGRGGSNPVVVLLHPGVGDSRIWDLMWPDLTSHCRVIRYDVRGYGRSPAATQEYTLVGDLQRVLDHFQLASVHLVGCSMGGGAAIDLTLAEPERIGSLTLLCPGISGYPWPDEPEIDAEYEELAAHGENGEIEFYRRLWAAAGAEPQIIEQLRSAVRAGPSEKLYQRPGGSAFDRLGELHVPTVLMVGDVDRPALITADEEAARRIPGCVLIRMPGVDHLPPLREPDWVTRTVLDQVRGSGAGRFVVGGDALGATATRCRRDVSGPGSDLRNQPASARAERSCGSVAGSASSPAGSMPGSCEGDSSTSRIGRLLTCQARRSMTSSSSRGERVSRSSPGHLTWLRAAAHS